MEKFIQKRAGDILKYGKKADSLLEITTHDDGINPNEESGDFYKAGKLPKTIKSEEHFRRALDNARK